MKTRKILCIVMLIILMVPVNIYGADSSMNFRYTLSANGAASAEAVPGDEIEVTVSLSRTDTSDSFPMYAIQYDLWYNADMLEIVEGSLNGSNGVNVSTRALSGSWTGWNSIVISTFSTKKDGDLWSNTVELLSLRMKTKKVGISMILSHQTSVSTTNGMDSYVTESNDASIIVRNPSGPNDEDSGNDPVNPDPDPNPTPNPGGDDDPNPSMDAANRVISLIESIGTVTLDSESSITAARNAYDRLSQTEQSAVTNYEILVQAEAALAELKKAQDDDNDPNPSLAFQDLDPLAWYREAIGFVLNNKYFQGTSDITFEPDGTMTRAMFVTVLSRLEGINAAQYSGSDFTDVETGQWYTAAIQWASRNGIVMGVGDQQFDPNGEVTREQMAAIMYRYAQYKKMDTTKSDASKFASFSDKDRVSDWAVEAMTWATGVGIINGTDAGIEPQANSTRAQVAQIVKNYTEKVS